MSKCTAGETWLSSVNHQDDDAFTITIIDTRGNFIGFHGHNTITGQCKGGRITYYRGPFFYDGRYTSDDELSGRRYKIHLEERLTLVDDDEWSGTHVTLAEKDKGY